MDDLHEKLASLRIDRLVEVQVLPGKRGALLPVLGASAGLVAAAAALYALAPNLSRKAEVDSTEVSSFNPGRSTAIVTATGYVVPRVSSRVSSAVGGRIARLLVREGDRVESGAPLAEIESDDVRSALASATVQIGVLRARARAARATLAAASLKLERERGLMDRGAISKAEFEDLAAANVALVEQAKAAEAEVSAAIAERARLEVNLARHTVTTPIAGTIVKLPAHAGEPMMTGGELAVAEIVDFGSLVAEVAIPEARFPLINRNQPCELVFDAFPSLRVPCAVSEIGSRVDRAKATAAVTVTFDLTAARALPQMSVRVSFLTVPLSAEQAKETAKKVVPSGCVVERDGRKVVFVLEQDRVRQMPVTVGGVTGGGLELLDGPDIGTRVVTSPPEGMRDGTRVTEKGG